MESGDVGGEVLDLLDPAVFAAYQAAMAARLAAVVERAMSGGVK